MKKLVLIAILGMFLLISCKKGKADFTLTGTITDSSFDTSLTGATVKLFAKEAGTTSINQIASTTLDANGNYSFTFPRDKVETYYLEIQKDNYFDIYEEIPFSELSVEDDNVRDYSTTAKAWVRFRVLNTSGSASDVMQYAREQGKINCEECCASGSSYFYGTMDSTFYCINDGNSVYSGYYWVQGGQSGPIYAVTPPFDTVDVVISY